MFCATPLAATDERRRLNHTGLSASSLLQSPHGTRLDTAAWRAEGNTRSRAAHAPNFSLHATALQVSGAGMHFMAGAAQSLPGERNGLRTFEVLSHIQRHASYHKRIHYCFAAGTARHTCRCQVAHLTNILAQHASALQPLYIMRCDSARGLVC